jgi:hypothetical protein
MFAGAVPDPTSGSLLVTLVFGERVVLFAEAGPTSQGGSRGFCRTRREV